MVKHPAKFSNPILEVLKPFIAKYDKVLDPFGGVCRLKEIKPDIYSNEIEFEWAVQAKPANAICGNALHLPYASETFDAICTSCTYGNRMADSHNAKDSSKRNTYTHTLGRKLHVDNSGHMQWGQKYRDFHRRAWRETDRVLKNNGIFFLNVSDHIRKWTAVDVTGWHFEFISGELKYTHIETIEIETQRQRFGANSNLRSGYELLYIFQKTDY